jgi:hypothetical protein
MADERHSELQMSKPFADLVFFALDHGVNSVREGGVLVPFIVYENDEKRSLHRYAADTLEESLRQARLAASRLPGTVEACAIAYDGFVTLKNRKFDAIIVEAAEHGKSVGVKLAQRYHPKRFLRPFRADGNPLSLGTCVSMFVTEKEG